MRHVRTKFSLHFPFCEACHTDRILHYAYCIRHFGRGWITCLTNNNKGIEMQALTELWHTLGDHPWLGMPFLYALLFAMLLWTGRIRHPAAINVVAIGLILPCINLGVIATGIMLSTGRLQVAMGELMPF